MNKLRALLLLACLGLVSFCLRAETTEPVGWDIRALNSQGEVEFDQATGVITAQNGVIITYGDSVLTAGQVTANQQTGEVLAEKTVTIKTEGNLWTGERIIFNFKTKQMSTDTFKTGHDPFFLSGKGLGGDISNKTYTATNILATTDDYAVPFYKVRARQMSYVPGKYFEAKHATLYLGNVPVMYFPHYKRSLERHPNNFEFSPGYRSDFGPYLLTTYNWYVNEYLDGSVHFDARAERGLAGGPDFNYDAGKFGKGKLEYYMIDDGDPGFDYTGKQLPRFRQRLKYQHKTDIDTNFTFKTAIRYQNDPFVVRDFYEGEYRQNIQPSSFAELNKAWSNWSLNTLVQPRINDFYETVERLPDVKLTGLRQQIGETPLYYDSESSFGYFQRKFATTNAVRPDFSAGRGDTYHQVTLPKNFFGWLNVSPRVGGRYTYYTEAHGPGSFTSEESRFVFNTGMEISTKASRTWEGAESKFWDVQGLRHILEPSVNYVFVPDPTRRPPELPQFDYELPSLRLLPIDYPDYNAIDSIDSQNVLRFTLRNKLQTKREQTYDPIDNLINWALYTDWRLDPRPGQKTFADLYSDFDIRPRSWLTLNSELRLDIERARIREANHRLTILPNDRWSYTIGHRYLDEDPALGAYPTGHNLFYDSFYYRVNENWAFRWLHYFEARDGMMEEQQYTIYRDLRSWTTALTLRIRDSRVGQDDFTIAITFSLKAFPRFRLGQDRDNPLSLIGG